MPGFKREDFSFNAPNSITAIVSAVLLGISISISSTATAKDFTPREVTDMLHLQMTALHSVYSKKIIARLVNKDKVISASEEYEKDKALPLPAQMFRFGAEAVSNMTNKYSYSMLSEWPINPNNIPITPTELKGFKFIVQNEGKNFYTTEEIAGKKFFTAIYASRAISEACVTCHNNHKSSPKKNFILNDIMGGIVIRLAQDK